MEAEAKVGPKGEGGEVGGGGGERVRGRLLVQRSQVHAFLMGRLARAESRETVNKGTREKERG